MAIERAFAIHFARDWVDAWNDHDLPRILAHYADDFEMRSPMIAKVTGDASGVLKGKAAVGAYWARALQMAPDLHFELMSVYAGVDSVAVQYRGVGGRVAVEVFSLGADGKVVKAHAHYEEK